MKTTAIASTSATPFMGIPVLPDFFDIMYPGNTGLGPGDPDLGVDQIVPIDTLIDYYIAQGMQRIVIFDLTCSVYGDLQANATDITIFKYLSHRSARKARNRMCNVAYGGNVRKRRSAKMHKKIKNTKRRKRHLKKNKTKRKYKRR
jgi:hypothetical protein